AEMTSSKVLSTTGVSVQGVVAIAMMEITNKKVTAERVEKKSRQIVEDRTHPPPCLNRQKIAVGYPDYPISKK
ncbi:MAG: hypothetical protein ACYC51_09440, partial [Thermoleophilia bacterium]